ncbi:low molecular weight protein-tyrosine-phosphatase, partial [Acidaminococcus fermentans]|uniref:low molecular weight protein-tyrosine-phosphatase n=2 Tax=Acidaminococcus fermentans TaxID=905 RepID=UPI00307940CD
FGIEGSFVSMIKILFICHGNICRSTMAEFVMKELVRRNHLGDAYEIASVATSREEIGNDTHWGTKEQLELHHIPYTSRKARQMTREDYGYYDLLIGFDDENLREIRRIAGGDPDRKIHLLLDFTDHPREIADPWYTGDFVSTYRDVMDGCESLLHEQQACQHPRLGKQGLID